MQGGARFGLILAGGSHKPRGAPRHKRSLCSTAVDGHRDRQTARTQALRMEPREQGMALAIALASRFYRK